MKLKFLNTHKQGDVPDYIIQNIKDLAMKMVTKIGDCTNGYDPNIILAALSWVHAAFINNLISDDPEEKTKAALNYAKLLILDIQRASKIKILDTTE